MVDKSMAFLSPRCQARLRAEKAKRRASRAEAKAMAVVKQAEASGVELPKEKENGEDPRGPS